MGCPIHINTHARSNPYPASYRPSPYALAYNYGTSTSPSDANARPNPNAHRFTDPTAPSVGTRGYNTGAVGRGL